MIQSFKCVGKPACHLVDVVEKIRDDVSTYIIRLDNRTPPAMQ
jgi:hypothetical protein